MREIFKGWLKEFRGYAYDTLYCMGEDGDAPSPMRGDRFFLVSKTDADTEGQIFMWSSREEEFFLWNDAGSWIEVSRDSVPQEISVLMKR